MRGLVWKRYISGRQELVIIRKKSTVSFIFVLLKRYYLNEHFATPAVPAWQLFLRLKKEQFAEYISISMFI